MLQQIPSSNSFSLAQQGIMQTATPFSSFNNQIRSQTQNNSQQALFPLNPINFSKQNSVLQSSSPQVIPNILQNNQQQLTENQQNLICMKNNNLPNSNIYLNNGSPNLINTQPSNLNNNQNNYQNISNLNIGISNDQQQNMLQLQMMNLQYKQIIQQQQQQLNQLQIQQQLQQVQNQLTQQQQQQQFNQIYSQSLPLSLNTLTTNTSSLNDVQLQFGNNSLQMLQNQIQNKTTSSIKPSLLNQYNQFTSQINPTNESITNLKSESAMNLYADISKIKLEIPTQIPKQLQSQEFQDQQQNYLSNQSSPQQTSTQQQSPLSNFKQDVLSIATTQSGQNLTDSLSQTNITQLNLPQFSFQTNEFNAKQQLQNQINPHRQTSFSSNISKLDEEMNFDSHNSSQKIKTDDSNNTQRKRKQSIAIGSHQNNFEGDSSSLSYQSKDVPNKNNDIQEAINKKRFMQVKQEEQQCQSVNNLAGIMSLNIPQNIYQKLNSLSSSSEEKISSSDNSSKLDSAYLEFAKLSTFDNLSESSKAFDKLLSKLSVNQTVDLILSTLPPKPEEQTNFENKFVNSMKAKQSKDKRNPNALYMTRFHNLTRLLMYNIVQLFSFDILSQNLNIHFYISQELENICRKIKQHARQTCNGQFKTDFYTHSHYNGLFLILDKNTISHIKKSPKDIEIHEQVFGVNLLDAPSEKLDFEIKKCNFFKVLSHEILMKCSYQSSESSLLNGDDARRIYFRRALSGISKLNKGQIVHRF